MMAPTMSPNLLVFWNTIVTMFFYFSIWEITFGIIRKHLRMTQYLFSLCPLRPVTLTCPRNSGFQKPLVNEVSTGSMRWLTSGILRYLFPLRKSLPVVSACGSPDKAVTLLSSAFIPWCADHGGDDRVVALPDSPLPNGSSPSVNAFRLFKMGTNEKFTFLLQAVELLSHPRTPSPICVCVCAHERCSNPFICNTPMIRKE